MGGGTPWLSLPSVPCSYSGVFFLVSFINVCCKVMCFWASRVQPCSCHCHIFHTFSQQTQTLSCATPCRYPLCPHTSDRTIQGAYLEKNPASERWGRRIICSVEQTSFSRVWLKKKKVFWSRTANVSEIQKWIFSSVQTRASEVSCDGSLGPQARPWTC